MSAQATHNPGPWTYRATGEANVYMVFDATGKWLFSIRHNGEAVLAKQLVNMALLVEAPELLAQLEAMVGEDDGGHQAPYAKRAIAKAKGEAP